MVKAHILQIDQTFEVGVAAEKDPCQPVRQPPVITRSSVYMQYTEACENM